MCKKKIIIKYIIIYSIIILVFSNKINKINSDNYISDKIIDNVYFLKYIHPNIITISGLIINFYIYYLLYTPHSNIYLLTFFMIYRWLADCLDGAVARKYNKGSKLGHHLDTISDIILGFICINYIQSFIFNLSFNYSLLIYLIFLFILNKTFNFIETHDNLKKIKNNKAILNNFIVFNINNPIFMFLFIILVKSHK
jgi:hypothetical protein